MTEEMNNLRMTHPSMNVPVNGLTSRPVNGLLNGLVNDLAGDEYRRRL